MFSIELKNRFSALQNLDTDIQQEWDNFKNVVSETSEKTLGHVKRRNKEWLSAGTWKHIEERKKIKLKLNNTKSKRIQDQSHTK